jgi:hypothetical protein
MRMKYQRKLKHGKFMLLVNHFICLFNGTLNSPDYTESKCAVIQEG